MFGFFHNNGVILNPTIKSRICLPCWAFTKSKFNTPGLIIALLIAVSVISWKIIRLVVYISRLNCWHICHAIASPSLSSSVASITSLDCLIRRFILSICCFFDSIIWKLGKKLLLKSTWSRLDRCVICPKLPITL